jgi:hypothetical protein
VIKNGEDYFHSWAKSADSYFKMSEKKPSNELFDSPKTCLSFALFFPDPGDDLRL